MFQEVQVEQSRFRVKGKALIKVKPFDSAGSGELSVDLSEETPGKVFLSKKGFAKHLYRKKR